MGMTHRAVERPEVRSDERLRAINPLRKMVVRPEMGAVAGSIAVFIFFAIVAGSQGFLSLGGTASYLAPASELGILAVAVALLMIGGEFDLSIGSILGASGMIVTILAVQYHWNIWAAILVAVVIAVGIGFVNGIIVVRTGLPSFIVTLGTLFIFRGATIGITRLITGRTQVGGLDQAAGYDLAHKVFASSIHIGDPVNGGTFGIEILWWLGIAALATWALLRTPFGNWIFGSGGDAQAARNVGVPVSHVKILLFMFTALAACLVAIIEAVTFTGSDVLRGENQEFYAIIAVVVGGTLLTGGYGSAIGSVFGALIFGMMQQGIIFAGVDADWYLVFLGGILLAAVLLNRYVRSRALEART